MKHLNTIEKSAKISKDRLYRYELTRRWAEGGKTCVFIGLNPSTADENLDDPTIRRCVGFAKEWGYNELVMLNAYAYRSTDPKNLKTVKDPVGRNNRESLLKWVKKSNIIIAAWGANIDPLYQKVLRIILPIDLCVLRLTKNGFPSHPLYLPKTLIPQPWRKS